MAKRPVVRTAPVDRSDSSTAAGMSEGSFLNAWYWSGWSANTAIVAPNWFRVVGPASNMLQPLRSIHHAIGGLRHSDFEPVQ